MQPNKKEIIEKIDFGIQFFKDAKFPDSSMKSHELAINTYLELRTLLCDLINRYAPQSSAYQKHLAGIYQNTNFVSAKQLWFDVTSLLGILTALKVAYEADLLQSIEEMIHGDVFEDFLEMGYYLLQEKYKDPAAVLIGGVLEEHIRKMCQKHNIPIIKRDKSPQKTSTLNDELAKAGVYNKGDQKSVTSWLDIRNSAAHGKYGEYTIEQVDLMLRGIRDFISRNPA